MKVVALTALMILAGAASFSENVSLDEWAYEDWRALSQEQKEAYVSGFLTAWESTIHVLLLEKDNIGAALIHGGFPFGETVGEVVEAVNEVYKDEGLRKVPVAGIIMYQKEFLNEARSHEGIPKQSPRKENAVPDGTA